MILQRLGILQGQYLHEPRLKKILNMLDFIGTSGPEKDGLKTAILVSVSHLHFGNLSVTVKSLEKSFGLNPANVFISRNVHQFKGVFVHST